MAREKVFRFKQFSVRNDKSAMKVGTDGVLLGAWADVTSAKRVLDIGTGTGLIALMIAQRCNAKITAVEIDNDAACEASQNFLESPWAERLSVEKADFEIYANECTEKYDVIVSNPPYFVNSLECPDDKRTKARHTDSLSYNTLIEGASKLLTESGSIFLITPSDVEEIIDKCVKAYGMYVVEKVYVCPVVNGLPKRILWKISKNNSVLKESDFAIEIDRHKYTQEYISLTREYYLNM